MSSATMPLSGTAAGIGIGAWTLLVVSAIAVLTRLSTKWSFERVFNLDDGFAIGALLTSIGSAIAVHLQAGNGLATPTASLEPGQTTSWLKVGNRAIDHSTPKLIREQALYAMNLLYIATLCFAKLSIIALIRKITPDKRHRRTGSVLGGLIGGGSLVFGLAAAFQCQVPNIWDSITGKCYERVTFWRVIGAFEIVLDVGLVALPLYITIPLNMRLSKKLIVLSSFSTRIFDIAATAIQLYFTKGFASLDPALDMWPWVLMAQITQCISIVTSCVPYLRPFLESLSVGLVLTDDLQRRAESTGIGRSYYSYYGSGTKRSRGLIDGHLAISKTHVTESGKDDSTVFSPEDNRTYVGTAREWVEMGRNQGGPHEGTSEDDESTSLHSRRGMLQDLQAS